MTARPRVTVEDLVKAACVVAGINGAMLRGDGRGMGLSALRNAVCVLANRAHVSPQEIASAIGRDPKAVYYALQVARRLAMDPKCFYARDATALRSEIEDEANRIAVLRAAMAAAGKGGAKTETKAKAAPKPPAHSAYPSSVPVPVTTVVEIRRRRREGWSLTGLARHFNLDPATVRTVCGEPIMEPT